MTFQRNEFVKGLAIGFIIGLFFYGRSNELNAYQGSMDTSRGAVEWNPIYVKVVKWDVINVMQSLINQIHLLLVAIKVNNANNVEPSRPKNGIKEKLKLWKCGAVFIHKI